MPDLDAGGPYRDTALAVDAPPPKGFHVREADGELVIEQRWRMDASSWTMGGMVAGLGVAIAYGGGVAVAVLGGIVVTAGVVAALRSRTTLTLRRGDCTI